jgi:hypothetical protein
MRTNSYLASQEIPLILWNGKVHCRVQNSPPIFPLLNQIYRAHVSNSVSLRSTLILSCHLFLCSVGIIEELNELQVLFSWSNLEGCDEQGMWHVWGGKVNAYRTFVGKKINVGNNHLEKTLKRLNYISNFSSYRAVNTLHPALQWSLIS